jgi:hypothetical protein
LHHFLFGKDTAIILDKGVIQSFLSEAQPLDGLITATKSKKLFIALQSIHVSYTHGYQNVITLDCAVNRE